MNSATGLFETQFEDTILLAFQRIYQKAPLAVAMQFSIFTIYFIFAVHSQSTGILFFSAGAMLIGCASRVFAAKKLLRVQIVSKNEKWLERAHDGGVLASALAWGIPYADLFFHPEIETLLFPVLSVVIAGICASFVNSLTPHRALGRAALFVMLGLPLLSMICFNLPEHYSLALMTGLYLFYLLKQVSLNHGASLDDNSRDNLYRILFNSGFVGIVIHREGKVVGANEAFASMFEIDKQKLYHSKVISLIHPDFHQAIAVMLGEPISARS